MRESDWAKANSPRRRRGRRRDGTSGLRQAADTTVREEIEKFVHIIFSSSPAQREFWSGRRGATLDQLRERYDGCKPCLHGSDAHDQTTVGQPYTRSGTHGSRAVSNSMPCARPAIDPEGRAYVGTEPPRTAMPSQVISRIRIADADWAGHPHIPLNPGLVAIVGARGSGKTALADVIQRAATRSRPQPGARTRTSAPLSSCAPADSSAMDPPR